MVLTKAERVTALQHEANILLHLGGKIDRAQLTSACVTGTFDRAANGAAGEAAKARDLDATLAEIATHSATYATLLADVSDDDLRATIPCSATRAPAARRS